MPTKARTLVVGTTSDYIDWIRSVDPGQVLFLTDPVIRRRAQEASPAEDEEVLSDLTDYGLARESVDRHLRNHGLSLDGIACFDCESMELAAILARDFSLPYPSAEAVGNCRDKHLSSTQWRKNGLNCPRTRIIRSEADAGGFFREIGGPCVLKPVNGSGSELVFLCSSELECAGSFQKIVCGLHRHRSSRLYRSDTEADGAVIAQEFIGGDEYSCDFLIEGEQVTVIRLSRKILARTGPLGTARAYVLPVPLPDGFSLSDFKEQLREIAEALGIARAVCMLDFFIRGHEVIPLELAPRPGGDCLPFLLRQRLNLDILKLNLDFARRRPIKLAEMDDAPPYVGLRLHAGREGVLKEIDTRRLSGDPRVREIHLNKGPGHVVKMPPADYDSWLLGHIIFSPVEGLDLETQCDRILGQLTVAIN